MNKWQNLGNLYVTQKLTAEFAKRAYMEPLSKNRAEHCAHLIGHTGHQWRVANVAHVIWPASIVQKPHHVNPGPSINSDQDYIMIT